VRIIHLLRKPTHSEAPSVAQNSVTHGCGGLNINGTRIATEDSTMRPSGKGMLGLMNDDGWQPTPGVYGSRDGRWGANLILEHRPGCTLVGTRQVKSDGHYPATRPAGSRVSGPSGHAGQEDLVERFTEGEEVEDWDCTPDCPVKELDRQGEAMGMHSAGTARPPGGWDTGEREGWFLGGIGNDDFGGRRLGDSGGASRFFKVVGGGRGSI
jgi:hypothetical protein